MTLPSNDVYFHELIFIALGMLFSLCSTMICVSEFFFLISGNNNALTLACLWAPVAAVSCILCIQVLHLFCQLTSIMN